MLSPKAHRVGLLTRGPRSADRVASPPLTRLLSAADGAVRIPPAGGAVASGGQRSSGSGAHAAQAPPGEAGELVGQGGWVGLAVGPQPMDAGALDHADDAVTENPPLAGLEPVDLDEAGDQRGDRTLDLADHLRELGVAGEAAAVEQAEGVAVFVDEAKVGGEPQLDHLVARLGAGQCLG